MKHYLRYLKHKFKTHPWQQLFLDIYGKAGFHIYSYYLFMEDISDAFRHVPKTPSLITVRFLGPDDMAQIGSIPERNIREPALQRRLQEGKLCFGLLYDETIIAFVWCNLEACHFRVNPFPLAENEAYIFDGYTCNNYRGAGLASYMRYYLYQEMKKKGKRFLYSVAITFNKPALRFKEKLNSRIMGKGLSILFLKRWYLVSRFTPRREYAPISDRWKVPSTVFNSK